MTDPTVGMLVMQHDLTCSASVTSGHDLFENQLIGGSWEVFICYIGVWNCSPDFWCTSCFIGIEKWLKHQRFCFLSNLGYGHVKSCIIKLPFRLCQSLICHIELCSRCENHSACVNDHVCVYITEWAFGIWDCKNQKCFNFSQALPCLSAWGVSNAF